MSHSHFFQNAFKVWAILGIVTLASGGIALASDAKERPSKPLAAEKERQFRPIWAEVQSSESVQRIWAALQSPTELEFVAAPLEDCLRFFAKLHYIPIVPDWTAIETLGLEKDTPVSMALSGVELRSALNLMLEPLGLSYVVEDEVLKIVPEAKAAESLVLRIYDVRRLSEAGFAPEDLTKMIKTTVDPQSWEITLTDVRILDDKKTVALRHAGRIVELWDGQTGKQIIRLGGQGKAGAAALPGFLVVRQTRRAHEEIAELLETLQKFLDFSNP
ncbi:MAG: hypothetical protein GXP27_08385 [Planctomycetes bacterium]|nr:hypothetical protein [Planctomycetota bacterium]